MSGPHNCPACRAAMEEPFFTARGVPVHQNLPMATREEAQACDRGDLDLAACPACGFISNVAFNPALLRYSPRYDNAQSYSPLFRSYLESLAAELVSRHQLRGKTVLEIGCGKGEFLAMLCRLGPNRGIGFDPSFAEADITASEGLTFIRDFYSARYGHYHGDLVCCRHVLEHVQQPAELMGSLRRSLEERPDTAVFFEVPDVAWILRAGAFWDIFYEHCSYFTRDSLRRLFSLHGFRVESVRSAFGGQYLWLEAFPDTRPSASRPGDAGDLRETASAVSRFARQHRRGMESWHRRLSAWQEDGKRCVLWGAGAKGAAFLNALALLPEDVPYVVDINPRKQGSFIAGTGQLIVPPAALREHLPDVILVMNPNYLEEIRQAVAGLGISGEIIPLQDREQGASCPPFDCKPTRTSSSSRDPRALAR